MPTTTLHRTGAILVMAIIVVVVATGCSLPFEWAGAMPDSWATGTDPSGEQTDPETTSTRPADIVKQVAVGPEFTLAWDDTTPDIATYRIYVRQRGVQEWQLLESDIVTTHIAISTSELDYGTYEFAVSSVTSDGVEHALHHSYDDSAAPAPWYLVWSAS